MGYDNSVQWAVKAQLGEVYRACAQARVTQTTASENQATEVARNCRQNGYSTVGDRPAHEARGAIRWFAPKTRASAVGLHAQGGQGLHIAMLIKGVQWDVDDEADGFGLVPV